MMADGWSDIGNWSETLSREQRSVVHGMLWFAVVSLTAFLLTGRTGIEALSIGATSGALYAGVVYAWNPY
jgi:small neutral amino acid transporter SnatA (MarC family)